MSKTIPNTPKRSAPLLRTFRIMEFLRTRIRKIIAPIVFAIILTLIVYYGFVPILRLFQGDTIKYIDAVLTDRGFIQYFSVFFFSLVIGKLLMIHMRKDIENKAFHFFINKFSLKEGSSWAQADQHIRIIDSPEFSKFKYSIIYKRIREGLLRVKNTQDNNAIVEYFKLRSEMEYTEMESEFSEVKFYNWLIPTLGFMGTVLGIGFGIKGFADMVVKADSFAQVKGFLPFVTHNLGVAFDTTLLALILSAIGIFYASYLSKEYGKLLEAMDGYCFDGISSKFKLYSTLADQLQQVFTTMNQEITRILNANRNDLNKTLKDFLTPIQTSLDEMKLILGAIHQKIPDIYPVINSATQAGLDISELRNVVVTNLREIQDSMGILGKELCERADRNDLHHQFNDIGDILRNVEKELKSIGLTLSMKNNSD